MINKEEILQVLKQVCDPEIPLNLVDLGLIKDIKCEGNNVFITMTLTTPQCPLEDYIVSCVRNKIKENIPDVGTIDISLSFEDVWKPEEHISEEGKKKLRELGWDI